MFFRNLINWILGFMLLNLDFKYSQSNGKQPPPWEFTDKRSRNHTTGLLQLWKATLKCNSTPDVFHYTYLNELLTIKNSVLLLTHQTPKYMLLHSFIYFNSPVPALFTPFEVSMLSFKFACFRVFSFCSVAAKFANLHAPTRFFGQRSFAIFISSRACSITLRQLVSYCVLPTTRSLYGLLSFLWS